MQEAPISDEQAKGLRFLRLLVTVLTATMILGLLTIVVLFVIRFSGDRTVLPLPDEIVLPDGAVATTFTRGADWYAVVTKDDQILIYDAGDNTLRQTIQIKSNAAE